MLFLTISEKHLLKSLQSCIPPQFLGNYTAFLCALTKNILNYWRQQIVFYKLKEHWPKLQMNFNWQHAVTKSLPPSVGETLWILQACKIMVYYLLVGLGCFFVGCYSKPCCHRRCTVETWDLWDGRVYSAVNHHVWCGLSGCVRGKCRLNAVTAT